MTYKHLEIALGHGQTDRLVRIDIFWRPENAEEHGFEESDDQFTVLALILF
jgi:hypothetical protein